MDTWSLRLGSLAIAVATALAIVALVLPLFVNPLWVAFAQDRAEATAWTGFTGPQLRAATDAILADLVIGPPDFDAEVAGEPVLNDRERAHMRDVRGVFAGFFVVTGVATLLGLFAALAIRRRPAAPEGSVRRSVRAGAIGLIVALVGAGLIAVVAFDALFETFHRLFFAGGTYTFDPRTERLVQLFPFRFWQESAIAVGAVAALLAAVVAVVASAGRAATSRASTSPARST